MNWLMALAGGFLGIGILLPVLAGYGAAHGCPFCEGYLSVFDGKGEG